MWDSLLLFTDSGLERAFWASPFVRGSLARYSKTAAAVQWCLVAVTLNAFFRGISSNEPLPLWTIGKQWLCAISSVMLLLVGMMSQSESRVLHFRNVNLMVCHRAACLIAMYILPMPLVSQPRMHLAESGGIFGSLPPGATIMLGVYLLSKQLLIQTGVAAVWSICLLWPLRFREHLIYHCAFLPALMWHSYNALTVVRDDARLSDAACVVYRALTVFIVLPSRDAAVQDELSDCPVEAPLIIVTWFTVVYGTFSPLLFLYLAESRLRLGFVRVYSLYHRPTNGTGERAELAHELANYFCHLAVMSVLVLNVLYLAMSTG